MQIPLIHLKILVSEWKKRSVRDRFGLLRSKYDKKIEDEEKASGISPEPTEVDDAMCDILKRFEEAEEDHQKEHAGGEKKKRDGKCTAGIGYAKNFDGTTRGDF